MLTFKKINYSNVNSKAISRNKNIHITGKEENLDTLSSLGEEENFIDLTNEKLNCKILNRKKYKIKNFSNQKKLSENIFSNNIKFSTITVNDDKNKNFTSEINKSLSKYKSPVFKNNFNFNNYLIRDFSIGEKSDLRNSSKRKYDLALMLNDHKENDRKMRIIDEMRNKEGKQTYRMDSRENIIDGQNEIISNKLRSKKNIPIITDFNTYISDKISKLTIEKETIDKIQEVGEFFHINFF